MTPWNPAKPVECESAPDEVEAFDRWTVAEGRGERPDVAGGCP